MIRFVMLVLVSLLSCYPYYTKDNSIKLSSSYSYYSWQDRTRIDDLEGDWCVNIKIVNKTSKKYWAQCIEYALYDFYNNKTEAWSLLQKLRIKRVVIINKVGVYGFVYPTTDPYTIYITPYDATIERFQKTLMHEACHLYLYTSEGKQEYRDFKRSEQFANEEKFCDYFAKEMIGL